MYPYIHPMMLAPHAIASAATVVTIVIATSLSRVRDDLDRTPLRLAYWPIRCIFGLYRRHREKQRRKLTAKALYALRHDREYLLALLPPHATNIVLEHLDPVSLGNLRQASRQAYLLVSSTLKHIRIGLTDLIKYSTIPLEAVYPNLEVIDLCLRSSSEVVIPNYVVSQWMAAAARGGIRPEVEVTGSVPTRDTSSRAMTQSSSITISVNSALHSAAQARFLTGLHRVKLIRMSSCTAKVDPITLAELLSSLPKIIKGEAGPRRIQLWIPAQCLQPSQDWDVVQQQRVSDPGALIPCLGRLLRSAGDRVEINLLGTGLMMRTDAQLRSICHLPLGLSHLHLLDAYPYQGTLDFQCLAKLKGLTLLAVAPRSTESLSQILKVLPSLPNLSTLLLGRAPVFTTDAGVGVELDITHQDLSLASLTSLEASSLRIRHGVTNLNWPELKHLGVCSLNLLQQPLHALFPGLTSLSLGRCPLLEALCQPCTDLDSSTLKGDTLAHPVTHSIIIKLPDLGGLERLQVLELCGTSASRLVQSWISSSRKVEGLSRLRALHLWWVASIEDLFMLLLLGTHVPSIKTVGLHHCGPATAGQSQVNPNTHGPVDVARKLVFAQELIVQGGDYRIIQHLAEAGIKKLQSIRILEQPHLTPSDVVEILEAFGQTSHQLHRLEVRACRHVTSVCGQMLQQKAVQVARKRTAPVYHERPVIHVSVDDIFVTS